MAKFELTLLLVFLLFAAACDTKVSDDRPPVPPPAGALNKLPVAVGSSFSTPEGVPLTGVLKATDANGDKVTFAMVAGPEHATVTVQADGHFTYTPAAGYAGADSFTFKANDGEADSNLATVSITVDRANRLPVAQNASFAMVTGTVLTAALAATDIDGDTLSYRLAATAANGAVLVQADGNFTFTPELGFTGADSFTFIAKDGQSDSNVATVSITVVTAPTVGVAWVPPDTGQSQCYTDAYVVMITCPSVGQAYFGQDAQYGPNVIAYTINSASTATEYVTGLRWQRQDDGQTRTWQQALAYCDGLTLDGFSDWRLPNRHELQSIVNYGVYSPMINTMIFPGSASSDYWSSSLYAGNSREAWAVSFIDGTVGVNNMVVYASYARCVRP